MRGVHCCAGCQERHAECHSTCEKYKAARAEYDKEQKIIRDKRAAICSAAKVAKEGNIRRGTRQNSNGVIRSKRHRDT